MKLHIGCGNRIFDGWINLDIDDKRGVDIVDDALTLNKIDDNSCDIIYACHVLEHFGRKEVYEVLNNWYSKLKKGGILRLSVPNFEILCLRYLETQDIEEVTGLIVGGQKDKYDYHKIIFDKIKITNLLLSVGFNKVKSWNWREVEHSKYDDISQGYLPHMDKENGIMVSLNLEAIK